MSTLIFVRGFPGITSLFVKLVRKSQSRKVSIMASSMRAEEKQSFDEWVAGINLRRSEDAAKSVGEFGFATCRVRLLSGKNKFVTFPESASGIKQLDASGAASLNSGAESASVLYWMNRDQRVQDNWALLFAQRVALKFSVPLHVCFNLPSSSAISTRRHFDFQLAGLKEIAIQCKDLNIGFTVLPLMSESSRGTKRTAGGQFVDTVKTGSTFSGLLNLIRNLQVAALITDFSPLREDTAAVQTVSGLLPSNTSFFQVDAHNIVPAWHASDKLEYAARTIRRKLHEKSQTLLTEFPPVRAHPIRANVKEPDWESIEASVVGHLDESVKPIKWAQGGSRHGLRELFTFLHQRLSLYATARNDPTKNALSQLSPWFHFGHLSVQRAILEAQRFRRKHKESVDAFIEEAFVRRELSDNFCLYNPHYDSIEGAWSWAQETLRKHASDERKPAYGEEAMEKARTDDQLWNAAQRQLLRDGKIHGFLRMYWAKKILEWHAAGPEAALALGLRLNDRYSIDGSDPNGFVGVMWSICGIHDQGWSERTIFGKIRYMNYAGCKRKFDVSRFVAQYPP